ncbi:hypothetical protein [Leptospira interrogans]|uniref:hypothetical protein n=1 Tax=Leptospira interrogans TaxID=173 RepID=UPI0002B9B427|nr:hypothetical protein [Leptospira interrogans]MCR8646385.1 hypothetical protein [Leptospira interrogans serovar Bataviae]OAM78177.1 hypothetical protein A1343_04585 [Leptospira interrogans serovar Bataviae]QOI39398.1 hypothetical protein Lepto1548_14745 [Leptospira interrogans serovar Bataviae]QYY59664.1 hypothetical protein GR153_013680 [Leptospira interrogans serovar Bataviae]
MSKKIEEKIKEFISIAEQCPEKYQVRCFELLVQDYLSNQREQPPKKDENSLNKNADPQDLSPGIKQSELELNDLHVKVKNFIQKTSLKLSQINSVFYKEDENILLLVDDLKAVKSSEVQIRVALLNAFVNAINTGNFEFDGEAVRAEVQKRKAYDKNNFAANFKNNASLLDGISSYSKENSTIKLSEAGKEKISELIKELA